MYITRGFDGGWSAHAGWLDINHVVPNIISNPILQRVHNGRCSKGKDGFRVYSELGCGV